MQVCSFGTTSACSMVVTCPDFLVLTSTGRIKGQLPHPDIRAALAANRAIAQLVCFFTVELTDSFLGSLVRLRSSKP